MSIDKILAIFFSEQSGTAPSRKDRRINLAFQDSNGFDRMVASPNPSYYQQMASADISNILFPFRAYKNNDSETSPMPGIASGLYPSWYSLSTTTPNARTLMPFEFEPVMSGYIYDMSLHPSGDAMSDVVSNDEYVGDIDRFRNIGDIRTIGLRLPAIGVGWGYDTNGSPVPAGSGTGLFKGEVSRGYMVDPKHYIAAPIELKYDAARGLWTASSDSMKKHQHLLNTAGDGGPAFATFFR